MTRPFSFEGRRRSSQAETGIATLRDEVDMIARSETMLASYLHATVLNHASRM